MDTEIRLDILETSMKLERTTITNIINLSRESFTAIEAVIISLEERISNLEKPKLTNEKEI